MKDGYLDIPQGPGLGITLGMDFVRKHVSLSFMYQLRTWGLTLDSSLNDILEMSQAQV